MGLYHAVTRPLAPLGTGPGDVVEGIFDVAGLAVKAIGGVELQPLPAALGVDLHFINAARAKSGAGAAVSLPAAGDAQIGVVDNQVARLVFFVIGVGQEN